MAPSKGTSPLWASATLALGLLALVNTFSSSNSLHKAQPTAFPTPTSPAFTASGAVKAGVTNAQPHKQLLEQESGSLRALAKEQHPQPPAAEDVLQGRYANINDYCEALYRLMGVLNANRTSDGRAQLTLIYQRKYVLDLLIRHCGSQWRAGWEHTLAAALPRGIVTAAGNRKPLVNAFVNLYIIRNVLKCELPITLMHWGRDEALASTQAFFEAHISGVTFMDAAAALSPYPEWQMPLWDGRRPSSKEVGWQIKIACLYAAPYRETLFLDTDSMPLRDPTFLFTLPEYSTHGNLFWPDIVRWRASFWEALSLPNPADQGIDSLGAAAAAAAELGQGLFAEDGTVLRDNDVTMQQQQVQGGREELIPDRGEMKLGHEVSGAAAGCVICRPDGTLPPPQAESGQFLFNRAAHYDVLEWLFFLNAHMTFIDHFPGMLGDKDLYRLAFTLANKAHVYEQVGHTPSLALLHKPRMRYQRVRPITEPRWAMVGMVQYHPANASDPVFWHRGGGEDSSAKFPGTGPAEIAGQGPTHLTVPVSSSQADHMLAAGLGFRSHEVRELTCAGDAAHSNSSTTATATCPCSLADLATAEAACSGFSAVDKEAWPLPVSAVGLRRGHPLVELAAAARDAYGLLPFNEARDRSGSNA